jgi:hypothetical protein
LTLFEVKLIKIYENKNSWWALEKKTFYELLKSMLKALVPRHEDVVTFNVCFFTMKRPLGAFPAAVRRS